MENTNPPQKVLRPVVLWKNLYFYQKADALYQLTVVFCRRFLPKHGDRTVDQMIQAARSGKQNIIEGSEDGMTSTEMELKLLNVARGSLQELRADYHDYLQANGLELWTPGHPRYESMRLFCKERNLYDDYKPFVERWTAEEFCNTALTLCHIVDKLMTAYLEKLAKRFETQGGIKERMYAVRTGYRKQQEEHLRQLEQQCEAQRKEIERLKALLETRKD